METNPAKINPYAKMVPAEMKDGSSPWKQTTENKSVKHIFGKIYFCLFSIVTQQELLVTVIGF